MRCGGLSCRRTAVAAAASGGATTAPSAIAAGQGISGTSARATSATAAVVNPTAMTARLGDRNPVVLEIAHRRIEGRIQQHGRDEQRESEVRRNREYGRPRNESDNNAAKCQKGGIWRADAASESGKRHRGEDQGNERFEFAHAIQIYRSGFFGMAR